MGTLKKFTKTKGIVPYAMHMLIAYAKRVTRYYMLTEARKETVVYANSL